MPPSTASVACLAPPTADLREPIVPRPRRERGFRAPASTSFRSPISACALPPPDEFPRSFRSASSGKRPDALEPGRAEAGDQGGTGHEGHCRFLGRCLQAQCSVLCLLNIRHEVVSAVKRNFQQCNAKYLRRGLPYIRLRIADSRSMPSAKRRSADLRAWDEANGEVL